MSFFNHATRALAVALPLVGIQAARAEGYTANTSFAFNHGAKSFSTHVKNLDGCERAAKALTASEGTNEAGQPSATLCQNDDGIGEVEIDCMVEYVFGPDQTQSVFSRVTCRRAAVSESRGGPASPKP